MNPRAARFCSRLMRIGIGFLAALLALFLAWCLLPLGGGCMSDGMATPMGRKEIRFYKEGSAWYADVAGHTQSENRMVAGADTLIERFAEGAQAIRVTLSSDLPNPAPHIIRLRRIEHDAYGAVYRVEIRGKWIPNVAWLCNVTHTVFDGDHPKDIYIHEIVPEKRE